jgi:hypothetical protein
MLPSVIPKSLLNASRTFDMHALRVHHNCKIDTSRYEQGKRAPPDRTLMIATSFAMSTDMRSRLRSHVQAVERRCLRRRSYTEADELSVVVRPGREVMIYWRRSAQIIIEVIRHAPGYGPGLHCQKLGDSARFQTEHPSLFPDCPTALRLADHRPR